ncbi:MAG: SAM-dependent methyltransferase [Oleiphilaceae bacterium]
MASIKETEMLTKTSDHWSTHAKKSRVPRTSWRESAYLLRIINERVCGERIGGVSRGLHRRLKEIITDSPIKQGISIGCGRGAKEMALIQAGLVESFELYEIAEEFISQGQALAEQRGVADRVRFHCADGFKAKGPFDIVHWNDSLHHMPDVHEAVRWSRSVLAPEGIFYMDDYVGPNRFQWSDRTLEIANRIRQSFPDHYLENPHALGKMLPRTAARPLKKRVIEVDPSEAADSAEIISAIRSVFPSAKIWPTGGAILRIALTDVIHNLDEESDCHILELVALADEMCGESHYACALSRL